MVGVERTFKGVWIPKEIWLSKELTLQEKVFLVEIDSLDNERGCFASNGYFSEFFGLSKNRCSEVIKSLEKKRFISIEYVRESGKRSIEKRIIKVFDKPNRGIRKTDRPIRKVEQGYSEKCEGSNTSSSNASSNTINKDIVEIVNYLNSVTGKNYNTSTRKTRSLIKARMNEGFTLVDFKKVIDIKNSEWSLNQKMSKYLRPETLFGTKFESYLNQEVNKSDPYDGIF